MLIFDAVALDEDVYGDYMLLLQFMLLLILMLLLLLLLLQRLMLIQTACQ